jgi:hypothetical protein
VAQHPTTHVYSTVRLKGTSTQWANEVVTYGLRIGFWKGGEQPDINAGDVQLYEFLTNDASVSRTITGWNIEQGWAGDSSVGALNLTDGIQDDIVVAWKTFLDAIKSSTGSAYDLESIRLYNVGRDGKTGSAPSIYTPSSTWSGTGSGITNPRDCAVVSLQTATRGPSGRGRFFVGPLVPSVLASTGLLGASYITALAAAADTLVTSLSGLGGATADSRTLVVHRASQNGTQGQQRGSIVNAIRVGDMVDTQRRRTNKRREVYDRRTI